MATECASSKVGGLFDPLLIVHEPRQWIAPFVFSSPHSGRTYPDQFIESSRLDALSLRKSEDCFVDELFAPGAYQGAPLLAAQFPRAYLDVNREPFEFDPKLFVDPLPDYANASSTRVVGGLGTIARIVADGEEIYKQPPTLADALARVEALYRPFHHNLDALLRKSVSFFGYAVLIDCHSMPSASMTPSAGERPDIVLGDRFGAACDGLLTAFIKQKLEAAGYTVHINRPYAGGYITEHYGRPFGGVHAIQLEVNRGLYLDERRLTKTRGFEVLQAHLTALCRDLFLEMPVLLARRNAAE